MLNSRKLSLSVLLGRGVNQEERTDDLFTVTANNLPRVHEFFFKFDDEIDSLPIAVAPNKDDAETLFADVATYYPQMSPISAYMHVLGDDLRIDINEYIKDPQKQRPWGRNTSSVSKKLQHKVWIALIVAEAATSSFSNNWGEDTEIGYPLCRRSLCFALARTAYLYPAYQRELIASRWMELRGLAKMESSAEVMASILWLTNITFDTSSRSNADVKSQELVQAVHDLVTGSLSSLMFSDLLAKKYSGVSGLLSILGGDYDGRMQALTRITDLIRSQSIGHEIDALAIAFFCNAILPGSFSYVRFLSRLLPDYPSIIIWYGLFCGLSEKFDWSGVASGIGQKLSRDICVSFNLENRPTADIAFEELRVLARTGLKSSGIKPFQQRAMLVSLLPGVEIFARFPGREENPAQVAARVHEKEKQITDRDHQLQQLLSKAQELLQRNSDTGRFSGNSRRKKPGSGKRDDNF